MKVLKMEPKRAIPNKETQHMYNIYVTGNQTMAQGDREPEVSQREQGLA